MSNVGFERSAIEDGSRRAIEVAALFEDSVVEVAHLADPRAGVTRATRALLASGAAAGALALVMFVAAYAGAESRVLDALVPLAMMYGLYAVVHGLLRLFDERKPRDFTIGPDSGARFPSPGDGLPRGAFPLVRSTGNEYELCFTASLKGEVELEGHRRTLAELIASGVAEPSPEIAGAYAWTIADKAKIVIEHGQNTFVISTVSAPRREHAPLRIDWSKQAYTAAIALACGVFLAGINAIPPDPSALNIDDMLRNPRIALWLTKPPQEENKIPSWLQKTEVGKPGGGGKRAAGESGKMGQHNGPKTPKLYAIKGPKNNTNIVLAKKTAENAARDAGALGVIHATMETSSIGSIFGSDHALGNQALDAMGGLVGTEYGNSDGVEGLGIVGPGKGGGGTGVNTIGLTDLGTIGRSGQYPGGEYGRNVAVLHDRKPNGKIEPWSAGDAKVKGNLDRAIVRRVVRSHMNEVRFCYEKELMNHPELFGRVMAQFTIGANGVVVTSGVQSSTMSSPAVEGCIAQAVRRWEFPKPEGGGIVIVSYPFMLKAAGGEK
ncbi:MAG TPA: AgmX/PglI C-terminal domain-containing protein [Polyangia bacterium]|nr:AgmX/PglI C-terminal domain-containing protein [Polyangia bacterium]